MFKFLKIFNKPKFEKFSNNILNSKSTYIFLILIMLIQFILVSIIFFQNKKSKYIIGQTNSKLDKIDFQQKQLSSQLSVMQSMIGRMTSQLYMIQGQNKNQDGN